MYLLSDIAKQEEMRELNEPQATADRVRGGVRRWPLPPLGPRGYLDRGVVLTIHVAAERC